MTAGPAPWWRTAVIYQIYLRSFADGNGDGVGDLVGLRRRLPYVADLGVDGVWITPWYRSPMADGGYDVADYQDIDPLFGTLDDADAMVAEAHRLGLRVIVDLVPNHTSEQHPWFRAAVRAGRGSVERERYYFRDGRGPQGDDPPNNWISNFGGSAWTRLTEPDGTAGQWYLHTFAPQQPDLNWDDPWVQKEFDQILRFWLDRGVDGLRLDAVPALAKAAGLPDADYGGDLTFRSKDWVGNPHWDVEGIHDIFRRWRAVADGYDGDRVLVAEAVVHSEERLAEYLHPDQLHCAFNFHFLTSEWSAAQLRGVVDATLASHDRVGAPPTWALGNHDEVRPVTRYGRAPGQGSNVALGTRRAKAAALLMLALPGSAYVYQGEELGLPEVEDLPGHLRQDPIFSRTGGATLGRDGCRVPLPWSGTARPFGFCDPSVTPWLPQPAEWERLTADAQRTDPDSVLMLYRRALAVRHELDGLGSAPFRWHDGAAGPAGADGAAGDVLDFTRGEHLRCIVNLSDRAVSVDPGAEVLVSSDLGNRGIVLPDSAVWLRP